MDQSEQLAAWMVLIESGEQEHLNGNLERAEELYRRALDTIVSLDHQHLLHIATSENHLAQVLAERGQVAEAEDYFRKCLSAFEEILGGEHAAVGLALVGLADILDAQGRGAEAGELRQRAQRILAINT